METTRTAAVRMGEPPNNDGPAGGLPLTDFAARYTVCRRCNEVRIRRLGRGHLAEGGRLVLTLGGPRGASPQGGRADPDPALRVGRARPDLAG
jgi:hypothetical protein